MAEETKTTQANQQLAVIPPGLLLIIAAIGALIALVVALTQPEFNVVGWGGLGLAGLALLAWALMSPEQLKALFTGRGFRFGGVALLVTVVFLVALVAIYVIVRSQNLRLDVSQTDNFSLREDVRNIVNTLGADPTVPEIRILSFFNVTQAGQRDRNEVLLQDFVDASGGKFSYEFIDPDRNPLLTQEYGVTSGQTVIAPLNAEGEPDTESLEVLPFFTQEEIINGILRISLSGDFRAYFLTVQDGFSIEDTSGSGLSRLNETLTDNLRWTTQQLSIPELVDAEGNSILGDEAANGEVLVIPGGSAALADEQAQVIIDYLDSGGSVVSFASLNIDGEPTLMTADNIAGYLWDNFGFRLREDVVIDQANAFQSPLNVIVTDITQGNTISQLITDSSGGLPGFLLFDVSNTIEIKPNLPPNVTITELARTSPSSYTKPINDLTALGQQLTPEDIRQRDEDPTGPFTVAVMAENSETGARLVVFGSETVPLNSQFELSASLVQNFYAGLGSLIWGARFEEFFENVPQVAAITRPQDVPLFASDQQLRNINFVTVLLMPFGILFLGVMVWWNGRERSEK